MIDYSSLIDFLSSDGYADKTDCFSSLLRIRNQTLEHCKGTGSSLFLKTIACFLDKMVDTKGVFANLKIGQDGCLMEKANTYRVLYLDFSDFNAMDFGDAMVYLRQKMSETYKHFYKELTRKKSTYYDWCSHKDVLDIVEGIPSEDVLQASLCQLVLKLRGYEIYASDRKLAILIDNMVQLETVAKTNNYSIEMDAFLRGFIVEDVYKYCNFFLQISDTVENNDGLWFSLGRYRTHRQFSVCSFDIRDRFPEIIVAEECQQPFHGGVSKPESINWEKWIAAERREVVEAEKEEERKTQENIRQEKARYAIELLPLIPRFSPNMGIRSKRLNKHSSRYESLNTLLKKIYVDAFPKLDAETVYCCLQRIDYGKSVVRDEDELKANLELLSKRNPNWEDAFVNTSGCGWVQVTCRRKDDEPWKSPARPENVKVYAYVGDGNSQRVFTDSIRYLLDHAGQMFAAKIAVFERDDQMCYWIDPLDYPCLERYFEPYFDVMKVSMPFIAYKGMLGISKDFPGLDGSHNSALAHIISDYLMTLEDVSDIDLEDMFNHYIAKWNADLYEEGFWGFKGSSALSFVVILDSLDAILDGRGIDEQSPLLSSDGEIWRILSQSECWADVNEEASMFYPRNNHNVIE